MKKTKSSKQANNQSDVIIISEIDDDYDYEGDEEEDDRDGDTWHTVHGLTLTKYDKNVILHGKWLTDKIIHAAQLLLKIDGGYPVGSFQDPILGKAHQFEVAVDESVQIIHSADNHWITASTVGTIHPTVRVYDSLCSQIPASTKKQIAALIHTKEDVIILEFANIQVSYFCCK